MATTVTTSVELGSMGGAEESLARRADNSHTSTSNLNSNDPMQASLIADSQVPEGGYGWVAVTCCAVLIWWFGGTSYSWGVIQAELVKEGVSSASTLAFVGSLAVACISFLGILNARLIRLLGAQVCAMLGIAFLGMGEILSGFAVGSIGGLFVTAGAVMGIGISLCFMVVSVIPAQYFKVKRGLANGIVYAGGGLGGAVISFIVDALIQNTGIAWTFRALGLMTLATGMPAAFFIKERVPIPKSAAIEWHLFRDIRFTLLFLVGAIATFPLFVPPFFLPLYTSSLGMKSSVGAGVVAVFNFSSAVGRLMCGFFSDKLGPLNTLFLGLLLSAVSMLVLWPVSDSLGPLITFTIINGVANGGFFSTIPTVVGNVFGSARVTVAMGMIVTGWAGGYLLGSPIAGYILDASGGEESGIKAYRPAIFYAGSLAMTATVLAGAIRLKTDMGLKKRL
ncbi:major facilitator superfamily domain-containing protein [Aspergillus stella-maris]|uniref:major facilitator superfamily domain-containing protein n=1 Tax=Aspergillus stella-maris TaxID=1810926 RepID=UPI003CCD2ACF